MVMAMSQSESAFVNMKKQKKKDKKSDFMKSPATVRPDCVDDPTQQPKKRHTKRQASGDNTEAPQDEHNLDENLSRKVKKQKKRKHSILSENKTQEMGDVLGNGINKSVTNAKRTKKKHTSSDSTPAAEDKNSLDENVNKKEKKKKNKNESEFEAGKVKYVLRNNINENDTKTKKKSQKNNTSSGVKEEAFEPASYIKENVTTKNKKIQKSQTKLVVNEEFIPSVQIKKRRREQQYTEAGAEELDLNKHKSEQSRHSHEYVTKGEERDVEEVEDEEEKEGADGAEEEEVHQDEADYDEEGGEENETENEGLFQEDGDDDDLDVRPLPIEVKASRDPARDWGHKKERQQGKHRTVKGATGEEPSSNVTPLRERLHHDGGRCVTALLDGECITLAGRGRLRVLHGSVTVLGYTLTPSLPHALPVYSPPLCGSLLQAEAHGAPVSEHVVKTLPVQQRRMLTAAAGEEAESVALLECCPLVSPLCHWVTSLPQFTDLFAPPPGDHVALAPGLWVVEGGGGRGWGGRGQGGGGRVRQHIVPPEHHDTVKQIVRESDQGVGDLLALFCGGKGVGKSTLARYTVNALLNTVPCVAYMDLDVGQTEFTPSCCLSLTLVSAPLLGPPFTHQATPTVCRFFGQASPESDPGAYMSLVGEIWREYRESYSHLPLVVNTMGWVKGLGLSLLVDTLRLIQPAHVVQLNPTRGKHVMPEMDSHFLAATPGWVSAPCGPFSWPRFNLYTLTAALSPPGLSVSLLRAADLRHLALMAHLSPLATVPSNAPSLSNASGPSDAALVLQSARPYRVAWRSVALHVLAPGAPVVYEQLLYALNGAVVALCAVDREQMAAPEDRDFPRFFPEPPRDAQCLGFGLVRGIDGRGRSLYVVTSLSGAELGGVNALVGGSLELPITLLNAQRAARGPLPYVDTVVDSVGATSVKARRSLKRPVWMRPGAKRPPWSGPPGKRPNRGGGVGAAVK